MAYKPIYQPNLRFAGIEEPILPWYPTPIWGVTCGRGWWHILEELNDRLLALSPDYQVVQVKEKFGVLTFYYKSGPVSSDIVAKMRTEVQAASVASERTCESCGAVGTLDTSNRGWIKTLCSTCRANRTRKERWTL
jgi:hypothetical protein